MSQEGQNGWLQRLADENPDEAEFIQVEDRPDEADPEPWHELYWRAWESLRFDRPYDGYGGQRPIFYTAYSQYARDNDIAGTDFVIFHKLMCAIDAEWLEHVAQRAKEREEARK